MFCAGENIFGFCWVGIDFWILLFIFAYQSRSDILSTPKQARGYFVCKQGKAGKPTYRENMILESTFYTSKNNNQIHQTVKGFVWLAPSGAVLRQASRNEWDYAKTWGMCVQYGRLLFSDWIDAANGVSIINGVKSVCYLRWDGDREMFAPATPALVQAVQEAISIHAACISKGFIFRSVWLDHTPSRPDCDVVLCNNLPQYA